MSACLRWGWEAFERERASGGGEEAGERAGVRVVEFVYSLQESDNTNIQRTYLNISRDAGSAAVDHDGGHIGACMGAGEAAHAAGGGAAANGGGGHIAGIDAPQ